MLGVAALAIVTAVAVSRISEIGALVAAALIFIAYFLVRPVPALAVFALTMVFVDTIQLYAGSRMSLLDEATIPGLVLATLVVRRGSIVARMNYVREGAVIALFVLAVISSLVNRVPADIWLPGLVLMGKGIAFFYVALMQDVSEVNLRPAGRVVLGVATAALVLGLLELFAPGLFEGIGVPPAEGRAGLPSVKGIFAHPLVFAWFSTFVALFLFAFYAVFRRWWQLLLGAAFSLGMILAARRRAMLALGAGLAGGIVWEFARRVPFLTVVRRWAPSVATVVILFVVFLPSLSGLYAMTIERYVDPTSVEGDDPLEEGVDLRQFNQARVALYNGAFEITRDHFPLGVGLGRYGSWMSRVNYSPIYVEYRLSDIRGLDPENPKFATDTFWPQVLGEVGALGVVAYAVFLGAIGVAVWRASRAEWLTPWLRAFCLGAGMVLVQTLVESLASSMFHSPPRVYLVMGTLGGVLALAATYAATKASGDGPSEGAIVPEPSE